MLEKTRAITLHGLKYGDTGLVVHLYTEAHGRQSYFVKGAFSKKSQIKSNLFFPLSLLELEVYHKPSSQLNKIKEAVLTPQLLTIHSNPYKNAIAIFISEVLYKVLREEAANDSMFNFLFNSVCMLDLHHDSPSNFHLVFMCLLAKQLGFFPTNNYSSVNKFFDLHEGFFVSQHPSHRQCMGAGMSEIFSELLGTNYENSAHLPIDRMMRASMLDAIATYFYLHMHGIGQFKSLQVLHDVFA
ncbi:MAG TPA: DNA repair protein RecO [Bacteroidales bacterium]|nr:DNA repair protein RecO [Bacteroidales bacterium]